ncbi:MAG: hypothetical protein LUE27_06795 [Clostridia bacterium]|nr:hypothetical protein [Clostridia bacterium]
MKTFGERLKYAIKIRGRTQQTLEEMCGLWRGEVAYWVKRGYPNKIADFAKACKELDVSAEWVMTGEGVSPEMPKRELKGISKPLTREEILSNKSIKAKKEEAKELRKYETGLSEKSPFEGVNTVLKHNTTGRGEGSLYASSTLGAIEESMKEQHKSHDEIVSALARARGYFSTRHVFDEEEYD